MKTQREMNLHYWGAIHEMVEAYNKKHGADVKPWECVRYDGALWSEMAILSAPQFDQSSARYQFAVAILYDEQAGVHRPLFVGDEVYWAMRAMSVEVFDWSGGLFSNPEYYSKLSWNKHQPKRTFEINGVEFNSPVTGGCRTVHPIHFGDSLFFFNTREDVNDLEQFIEKLLIQARDK